MEVARHWRLKAQRYRLEGSICPVCGLVSFPPRPVCRHCAAQPPQVDGYKLSELAPSKRILDIVASKG